MEPAQGLKTRVIDEPKSGHELAEAKHPRIFKFMVWSDALLIALAVGLAFMVLFVTPDTAG